MIRIRTQGVVIGSLLGLALTPAFWPISASAAPEERDEICANYKGTALWGQCTRAVVHGCHLDPLAHRRCEQWAQRWRDDTGVAPPWLGCTGQGFCTVFLTSTDHDGNLGGLAGADAICAERAEAANLPGTYLAWLAASGVAPATRFTQAPVPYELPDGTTVAANWADLTDGFLQARIDRDEKGEQVCGPTESCLFWAGTTAAGDDAGGQACDGWASADPSVIGETCDTTPDQSSQVVCVAELARCERRFEFLCVAQ